MGPGSRPGRRVERDRRRRRDRNGVHRRPAFPALALAVRIWRNGYPNRQPLDDLDPSCIEGPQDVGISAVYLSEHPLIICDFIALQGSQNALDVTELRFAFRLGCLFGPFETTAPAA